jgi:REP element-mobilizing transposase RayT
VHVTLRAGLRSLRTQRVARTLLSGLRDSNRDWFRIVHYSVQENHVHLISAMDPRVQRRDLTVSNDAQDERRLAACGRFGQRVVETR